MSQVLESLSCSSNSSVKCRRISFYPNAHRTYFSTVLTNGLQTFKTESQLEDESTLLLKMHNVFTRSNEDLQIWMFKTLRETSLVSGIYWVISGITLLDSKMDDSGTQPNLISLVQMPLSNLLMSCYSADVGGYRCHTNPMEPDSVIATMNSVQCLSLIGCDHLIPKDAVIQYIHSLQDPKTGSFKCSRKAIWSKEEVDLRQTLCSLVTLDHLTARPNISHPMTSFDSETIQTTKSNPNAFHLQSTSIPHRDKLISWILSAQNPDGGFGNRPGSESHAGYTYCAIASLALLGALDDLKSNHRDLKLRWFLNCRQICQRHRCTWDYDGDQQCKQSSTLVEDNDSTLYTNGRPGKVADVCYSWWVLASLIILHRYFGSPIIDNKSEHDDHAFIMESTVSEDILSSDTVSEEISHYYTSPHWLDQTQLTKLIRGILEYQHTLTGGFSRVPPPSSDSTSSQTSSIPVFLFPREDAKYRAHVDPDPYHSFFALAALSLIVEESRDETWQSHIHLRRINPCTAFPLDVLPCPIAFNKDDSGMNQQ